MLLWLVAEVYRQITQPIFPFTWLGLRISTLELASALRICIVLRQTRQRLYDAHVARRQEEKASKEETERSLVKSLVTTLLVVYGGEAVMAPYLGVPPSFIMSGVGPTLHLITQALVERLPQVPVPSIKTEIPSAIIHGLNRGVLLCSLIPPRVTTSVNSALSLSPWALLVSSLATSNGGFFLTNTFSFLHPVPLKVTTPPELLPYGWTTTELWAAPLITGLYATLTHAQPFWAHVHSALSGWLGGVEADGIEAIKPLDAETARAACALLLIAMFTTRTYRNFGSHVKRNPTSGKVGSKVKTQ